MVGELAGGTVVSVVEGADSASMVVVVLVD
jgi:hypothetical protein